MDHLRRLILRAAPAAGLALLAPVRVLAADWNQAGFEAKSVDEALQRIGARDAADSADLLFKAPEVAENGAVIPIEVTSRIPGTRAIALLAEKNPFPLIAYVEVGEGAEPFLQTRIKLGQTSNVRAVASAGGKHYSAVREIKVTIGGCGG